MYLKYVNILYFIILTYLCSIICTLEIGMEQYRIFNYEDSPDCVIPMPKVDNGMPVIYSPETNKTIYPNRQGLLVIKINSSIRMSCSGEKNHFVSPVLNYTDIEVHCINKSSLRFNGVDHSFEDYRCNKRPVSKMKVVGKKCQKSSGELMDVGFETKNAFIILYRICFNMTSKIPVYTWYTMDVPVYRFVQNSTTEPHYFKTHSYDPIDIDEVYKNQQNTAVELLKGEKLGKWYVQLEQFKTKDTLRYVIKGHLMSKKEFLYTYEQEATYYNENTAPQWIVYRDGARKYMEKYFRQYVLRRRSKHLIVSGTFRVTSPLNNYLNRCHLYLKLPNLVPVPEFFWRMDYNLETHYGIVFVGYNGPFKNYGTIRQVCITTKCPYKLKRIVYAREMYYCCTKEDFEYSFGKFDEIIFKKY